MSINHFYPEGKTFTFVGLKRRNLGNRFLAALNFVQVSLTLVDVLMIVAVSSTPKIRP
jgi:hypothetical protein